MKSAVSKLPIIKETKIASIDDLLSLMTELREIRREMVSYVKKNQEIDKAHLGSFKNVEKSLENCLRNEYECDLIVDSTRLKFNIKDEYLSVQKDLLFLNDYFERNRNSNWANDFIRQIGSYHPSGNETFALETKNLTNLLMNATKDQSNQTRFLDYFITDWDGTFKTYCSNYSTCMQPAYSGVILSKFVEKFVKFPAVLTAGPLLNPGILDLTSIPTSTLINFGGSWGREWSLVDDLNGGCLQFKRQLSVVERSCFTAENKILFDKLTSDVEDLLSTKEFMQFKLVGSGFQKKVDRLTIGIQNVTGDVPKEKSADLLKTIAVVLNRLDPSGDVFHMEESSLDVEVAIKNKENNAAWSKGDGLNFIVNRLNLKVNENSTVVVCGDTVGDLSMVEYFTSKKVKVSIVFVNPNAECEEKLKILTSKSPTSTNLCIVHCPEVIHAAMLNVLKNDDEEFLK